MAELVRYPTEILEAVYDTHRYTALDKLLHRLEDDYRRFYGKNVVLSVNVELWDRDGRQVRLYQQERQVLRAIYVLAHRQNDVIVRFTPAELMDVLGYKRDATNEFSPGQREQVLRALRNLFEIDVKVEMELSSGGMKKLYGHFLDSYGVSTDRDGHILAYAVQVNVLIGADLRRFKLMPADLPKLITDHGPDQAVTTFADFCLLWEGQKVEWSLEAWVKRLQLDPTRRSRNIQTIERCAQWGVAQGLVLSWDKGRLQHDQRRVKFTMQIAPQQYPGPRADPTLAQEPLWPLVEHFYAQLGTKASAQKRARDVAVAAQLLADGFSLEDMTFAAAWAIAQIPGVTSFGVLPHVIHQALKARRNAHQAAAAQREAAARLQAQGHQEQEESARRQRLEILRASLAVEALEAFRRQAEEALAEEGVGRQQVGYNLLLRLRLDDLLEQAFLRPDTDA